MGKAKTETEAPAASSGSALVRPPSSDEQAALAALSEADLGGDIADGLGEVAASDLRTPIKLYNIKKAENAIGRVTQDSFFDTVDRTVTHELNLVLLDMHKSRRYAKFNKKEDRNVNVCSSYDNVTGVYEAAEPHYTRACKGCPDWEWRTDAEGKRIKPCGEVWTVAAFDLDAMRPCFIKFKGTGLDCIKNHLQAHHMNKRPMPGGKRGNFPLFVYRVRVTIGMHSSGNYAVPTIERGTLLSSADLRVMADTAAALRETFQARLSQADKEAAGDGGHEGGTGEAGDTSFDPSTFEGQGQRGAAAFVE